LAHESVSKIPFVLEIKGKQKLSCELKRHLSPKTVGIISRMLPIKGNAHFLGTSIVYIESAIDSGIERKKTEFKKSDIAFLPNNGCICFFFADTTTTNSMSLLGKILTNVDELKNVKSGDAISFYSVTN